MLPGLIEAGIYRGTDEMPQQDLLKGPYLYRCEDPIGIAPFVYVLLLSYVL